MKLYSMTATFGKLEHETLTLEPGLNIIEAPNEWGKSTWCAFLVSMLYGIDTRARTTKDTIADKERYAPWSGTPMSGRMDLNWDGRDITIQRSTKGRTPMGEFRAYETRTGLTVPELTAANCGQLLLGVERSVFTRSAFLRFSDLPVTNDENLRHRLNSLVTTGDESGAAEALEKKLKDLKNKCRHNKTGLLPQLEAQRTELETKINEQSALNRQSQNLLLRQEQVGQWVAQLENHKTALAYAAAQDDESKIQSAIDARNGAALTLRRLETQCNSLPSRFEAEQAIEELNHLRKVQDSLQMEEQMLPDAPMPPAASDRFRGISPEEAVAQAKADTAAYLALRSPKKPLSPLLFAATAITVVLGMVLLVLKGLLFGIPVLCVGALLLAMGLMVQKNYRRELDTLHHRQAAFQDRYGTASPDEWLAAAEAYQTEWDNYRNRLDAYRRLRGDVDSRRAELMQKTAAEGSISDRLDRWKEIISLWDDAADAARDLQQAENHLQDLRSMAKPVPPPAQPDELTFSADETNNLLATAASDLRRLQNELGQCQGKMDASGTTDTLQKELDALNKRISELERTYAALDIAQKALTAAKAELQRRFAPRIAKRTQELFSRLTGGRYDRLTLAEDLSVHTGALGEDTIRPQQWRSDGTVDQLYLALRLAVAQELIPQSPLILDDALVRFDDTRLARALDILQQEARQKQVLLFTCQSREKDLL